MISLGWNCRGLGNLQTVRVLGKLVQQWDPKIVFLLETKIKKKAMEKVMEKINFVNGLIVPKKGKGGGLAMLWKREVDLEIMGYSRSFIDAIITEQGSGFRWRITSFYGNLEAYRRKESREELAASNRKFQLPWLCYGDFNEIFSEEEKMRGVRGLQDPKGKWMALGRWLMPVVLKIWGIAVLISRCVTCKKGKITYI